METLKQQLQNLQAELQKVDWQLSKEKIEAAIASLADYLDHLTQQVQNYQPFWQEDLKILGERVKTFLPFTDLGETRRRELNRLLSELRHFIETYLENGIQYFDNWVDLVKLLQSDVKRFFM